MIEKVIVIGIDVYRIYYYRIGIVPRLLAHRLLALK